jgi:hypothetical protein
VLQYLALRSADDWYRQRLDTPSGDRDVFTAAEWKLDAWRQFYEFLPLWSDFARIANEWPETIEVWQQLSSCISFRDGTRTGHPQTRQAGCPTLLRQWLGGIPAFLLPTIVHQNCYSSVSY